MALCRPSADVRVAPRARQGGARGGPLTERNVTDPSQSDPSYYYRDNLNLNLLGLLAGEIVCPKEGSPFSNTQSPRRTRLRTPCNRGTCQVVPNLAWRPGGSWWARVAHWSALQGELLDKQGYGPPEPRGTRDGRTESPRVSPTLGFGSPGLSLHVLKIS